MQLINVKIIKRVDDTFNTFLSMITKKYSIIIHKTLNDYGNFIDCFDLFFEILMVSFFHMEITTTTPTKLPTYILFDEIVYIACTIRIPKQIEISSIVNMKFIQFIFKILNTLHTHITHTFTRQWLNKFWSFHFNHVFYRLKDVTNF